jgi:hypothetical protein
MAIYEYKVMPAPRRGEKARGAKTTAERFAHALTQMMNAMGREGWEYLRADTLPCDERVGLTGKATAFQNLLVFRRPLAEAAAPALAEAAQASRASLVADAPEGAAPRLGAPAVSAAPPAGAALLGPARDGDVAAE